MYEQRIQFRRDTAITWTQINPVLGDGEPAYEIDTGRWKIGDGITPWTSLGYMAEDGLQGPVGPQGPAGAASTVPGPAGPKGADSTVPGPATTITIGTVTAGNTPADAAASMSGTSPNQVLNLVLPKGDTGATGAKGDQGVQGVAGVQGNAGPVGPQGPQGLAGPAGPKGDAAGINIKGTATTWPPAASPANDDLWLLPDPIPAGTPSSYKPGDGIVWTGTVWLNVGPVRGPAGPEGPAGPVGPQGNQGVQGVQGVEGPQGVKGDRGDIGPVGPQGPQGVKGDTGAAGADAPPSNLTIGTVIEGPTADASITGTSPNFILNLTLPQPSLSHVTTFTVNPQNQTVEDGDSVTLTAEAQSTGTTIVYKWQKLGLTDWEDIPGAGGKTYTFNAATAMNGRQFRCYASTPEGAVAASMAAVLTVFAKPPADGTLWNVLDDTVIGPVSAANGRLFANQKYSLDGVNWEWSNVNRVSGRFKKVLYGNGIYFDGRYYSSDGVNFTDGALSIRDVTSLCFDGSDFVYHMQSDGYKDLVYKDPNGGGPISHTLTGIDTYDSILLQFSFGAKFFGTAKTPNALNKSIYTSPDGIAWTKILDLNMNSGNYQKSSIFGYESSLAEKYIIAVPGNNIWTSQDAVTWTKRTLPTTGDWVDLAFGNGMWIIIPKDSTTCLTSPDAINWTIKNTLPEPGLWDSLAFAANKFVAHKTTAPYVAISG